MVSIFPVVYLITACPVCGKDVNLKYLSIFGSCYDCIEFEENITNETFGMTIEWLLAKLYSIPYPSKNRINRKYVTPDIFNFLVSKIKILPPLFEYTGKENNDVDFITVTGKTVNVKTSQKIIGKKRFMEIFQIDKFGEDSKLIKQYILDHPKELLTTYYNYLFSCDYTIWISLQECRVEIIYKRNSPSFENISFTTSSILEWNESNTIKSNGKSIGEFQIHKHRDCVKFRFNMDTILDIRKNEVTYPFPLNYIGSKKTLLDRLEIIFRKYSEKGDIFCDMFCGTAIVTYMASRLGIFSKIISNDIMYYGYVMAKAMLFQGSAIISIDVPDDYKGGFITENYSSTLSGEASYFTFDNARKIDWIRNKIDSIEDEDTKLYLLASLLSSCDSVANTACVYGAFLKKFKSSALKKLNYVVPSISPIDCKGEVYNLSSEKVPLQGVDFLYLDPPYNCRGYDSNYHILETIAKNDKPQIKGKTGLRVEVKKSDFCSKLKAKKTLEQLIKKAKNIRVIVLSYNDDGICKINEIINMFKGRGLDIYRMNYEKFNSHREEGSKKVIEYLFVGIKDENWVSFFDIA